MKLVDILARVLKAWPEGGLLVVQDEDGEIKFDSSHGLPRLNSSGDVWIRQGDEGDSLYGFSTASDFATAIVTRAEWQAAVDALRLGNDHGEVKIHEPIRLTITSSNASVHEIFRDRMSSAALESIAGLKFSIISSETDGRSVKAHLMQFIQINQQKQPEEWNGEGLPPVGADVECTFAVEDHKVWHRGTVVHRAFQPEGDEFVVVSTGAISACYRADGTCVRPARTPEQIAAEECDKAVKAMLAEFEHTGSLTGHYEVCEALHKAGYRKFEIIDEPQS